MSSFIIVLLRFRIFKLLKNLRVLEILVLWTEKWGKIISDLILISLFGDFFFFIILKLLEWLRLWIIAALLVKIDK